MDQKLRFIEAKLEGNYNMTELCRQFGISRKTGYKWWKRFCERGVLGLAELDRAAKSHPNATSDHVTKLVIAGRRAHPTWGPRKLRAWLIARGYKDVVPAASTIGRILEREGLVRRRRRTVARGNYDNGLSAQDASNAVWAADFKGHFKLTTGKKCYPLTISDGFSRFLLRCEALAHPNGEATHKTFEAAFHEYGLPSVIRSDNGTPFSGRAGISVLSLWWVKLGITPERIARGKPTQNGRHERIHRTLKADVVTGQAKGSMWAQQRAFDRWRREYNEERPHEALGNETPATRYESSPRRYPSPLREPEYGEDVEVQRAARNGSIIVASKRFTISGLLAREPIGLTEKDDGSIDIHYGPLLLASISPKGRLRRGRKQAVQKTHTSDSANGGERT